MIALVSGGFDPLHVGHIRLFDAAMTRGRLVVALNSDAWLLRKKGYVFMPWAERHEILCALKQVALVIKFNDDDDTACDALKKMTPHYFCNGGDRLHPNPAEDALCRKIGIKQIFDCGGGVKAQSSSELVRRACGNHAGTL